MVEGQAGKFGWTLGKRRVTRSDRWGVILRVDFAIDGTRIWFRSQPDCLLAAAGRQDRLGAVDRDGPSTVVTACFGRGPHDR